MNRKAIFGMTLTLFLISILTSAFSVRLARADTIKVLHVSAFYYNEAQEVVNIAGASQLFEVSQVRLWDFNQGNPNDLSAYDVIVFGISDQYESSPYYSPNTGIIERISELRTYVQQGGGIVWTHDSLEYVNDYGVDAEEPAGVDNSGDTLWGPIHGFRPEQIRIASEHIILHYPFEIGNINDTINILPTHTTGGEITTSTVIMRFNVEPLEAVDNFYLTVNEYGNGRVAVIELGCEPMISLWGDINNLPSSKESQIFVNSLFWASRKVHPTQYTFAIDSSPTGVTFTVDGVSRTTPWSGTYSEGASVSLVMPETHTVGNAKYYWDQWSNGLTSRSRTVIMNTNITLAACFIGPYYELAVTSTPITGVTFTINGAQKTTPHTEWLLEGSYTLAMPATHAGYVWSHWLEDGDTSRTKTITLSGTTWTGVFTPAPPPPPPPPPAVGGHMILTDKDESTPSPWTSPLIAFASVITLTTTISVVYARHRKKQKN